MLSELNDKIDNIAVAIQEIKCSEPLNTISDIYEKLDELMGVTSIEAVWGKLEEIKEEL